MLQKKLKFGKILNILKEKNRFLISPSYFKNAKVKPDIEA